MLISNIRENGQTIGALPDGEMMFHHDTIHRDDPHKATLLYSVEIPTYGGDTLFASGTAAYDTLDPAMKQKLEGLKAVNYYVYNSVKRNDKQAVNADSQAVHPVVRTHDETKRKALYVNRLMSVRIEGMPQERERQAARLPVRSFRKAGIRLYPCLAQGRPDRVGQSQFQSRPHRLPCRPAPAAAAHHGKGELQAVLTCTFA